jgi:hypothetical protein
MAPILARAAATARELLMDRASARWQVPRAEVSVSDGRVRATDGRTIGYGELVTGDALSGVVASNVALTPRARWALRGTPVPKVNGWAMVSGQHAFTPDLSRPGLRVGRIIRPPAYGAARSALCAGRPGRPGNGAVAHAGFPAGGCACGARACFQCDCECRCKFQCQCQCRGAADCACNGRSGCQCAGRSACCPGCGR